MGYEKNQTAPVWLFCYVLLIGFGVKAVMLCPGVFSPYSHFRRYDPELTAAWLECKMVVRFLKLRDFTWCRC